MSSRWRLSWPEICEVTRERASQPFSSIPSRRLPAASSRLEPRHQCLKSPCRHSRFLHCLERRLGTERFRSLWSIFGREIPQNVDESFGSRPPQRIDSSIRNSRSEGSATTGWYPLGVGEAESRSVPRRPTRATSPAGLPMDNPSRSSRTGTGRTISSLLVHPFRQVVAAR